MSGTFDFNTKNVAIVSVAVVVGLLGLPLAGIKANDDSNRRRNECVAEVVPNLSPTFTASEVETLLKEACS